MKRHPLAFSLVLTVAWLWLSAPAEAQPWLSNRFAQNCAACHAPGRLNVKPSERRCTLSCQGCHVNPNGGGMRNRYGVWTQERWLRSFYFDWLKTNKKAPAPFSEQRYAQNEKRGGSADKRGKGKDDVPADTGGVPSLVTTNVVNPIMLAKRHGDPVYDKNENSWTFMASSKEDWLSRVPFEDPYREERRMPVTAGGNFRYLIINRLANNTGTTGKVQNWLMSTDLGVRLRPINEHFQVVLEPRFLNGPGNPALEEGLTTEARIRSAYVISDDWQYNSYGMFGLYKPMFGLAGAEPNHYSIAATISGITQRSVYKGLGFGTAPNVPFFNVNLIAPMSNPTYDQSAGIVSTLGARFVTLGASIALSFWNTNTPDGSGRRLTRRMFSLHGGITIDRFIFNGEMLRVSKEFAPDKWDSGIVYTGQLMFQLFAENYLVFNLGVANLATNLKAGSSDEVMVGVKSFLISGTELELLWVNRNNVVGTLAENQKFLQLQTHIFF